MRGGEMRKSKESGIYVRESDVREEKRRREKGAEAEKDTVINK
jgi:hypothetical protein